MKATLLSLAVLLPLALACSRDVPGGTYEPALIVPPEPIRDLDILFVIDNSSSMAPHQRELIEAAGDSLFAQLADGMDDMPSLHVGVVSTDMGAGGHSIIQCTAPGDDGRLQHAPRLPDCEHPDGAFLVDVDDGAGGRTRNFAGTLGDAFSCIAHLGTEGCGFEQPMAAMRRALDGTHTENDGFLRDEAALLVVFVTDEDDCSASDVGLFDPGVTGADSALGPLASFRCTDHGIVCDEELRELGVKSNCRPRDDGEYLTPVAEVVEFLQALKTDPTMVMVAGIFGDPSYVEVTLDAFGQPQLEGAAPTPSAGAGDGEAVACPAGSRLDPGIRLAALAAAFPARYSLSWLCQQPMASQLANIAGLAGGVMSRSTCLAGAQSSSCRAFEATGLYTAAESRRELRACGERGGGPCFAVVEDVEGCAHTAERLAVELRDGELAPGAHLLVECFAPGAD